MIGGFSISPWGKTAQSPLVWAYDCFPFGMLMPGRYISDTSDHCMTISRSNWSTEMADTCKPLATLASTAYLYGNSTISTSGSNIVMNAPEEGSWIQLTTEVEAGIDNKFSFDVPVLEGAAESGMQVMIIETRDNTPYVIGGGYLIPGGRKQTISFNASGNTVNLLFNGPFSTAEIEQICTHYTKTTQQSYLVEVCDESKDRYRFGFNGKEKDNELKGVGNSLDFGARIYDSRVGRWLSLDPLATKYPSISPYAFVANSPLRFIDYNGKEIWIGHYDKKEGVVIDRLQYKGGKLYNNEGIEVTTNDEYINDIKNRLDNIKDLSISVGAMITKMEEQKDNKHSIWNYDFQAKRDENQNRTSYENQNNTFTTFNSENIMAISTPEATLGHELKHGFDRSKGNLNTKEIEGKTGNFIEAEWDALNIQNQILFNQGKELRMDYDGVRIPDDKFISPSKDDKPKKIQKPYPINTNVTFKGDGTINIEQKMSDGTSSTKNIPNKK